MEAGDNKLNNFMIIYKVTNLINNKIYIGQTKQDLKNRKRQHKYFLKKQNNNLFHNALRKYGFENFTWEILCECDSKEELDEMEFHYINQYRTFWKFSDCNGYNLTLGGEGTYLHPLSKNARQKMRDAKLGKKQSRETVLKRVASRKNYKHSEKTKQKIGAANKKPRPERRGKNSKVSKKYTVISPDGERYYVLCLSEFCRNFEKEKLHVSRLVMCARGKQKYYKGYQCFYDFV